MNKQRVHIHTPCGVRWESLTPTGTNRFCGACKKVVHDLSALSESEAEALLERQPTDLCVRYLYDEHGVIHFRSHAPLPVSRLTRLRDAATLVAPLLLQACGGADFNDPTIVETTTVPCSATSAPPGSTTSDGTLDGGIVEDTTLTEGSSSPVTITPCVAQTTNPQTSAATTHVSSELQLTTEPTNDAGR